MEKTKLSIRDYILQNPTTSVKQVMKATGAQSTSVHTSFTNIRTAYNKTPVDASGIIKPEGYPPLRVEDVEALNKRRFTITPRKHRKLARIENLKKARAAKVAPKKVIDLSAQEVKMPTPEKVNKQELLTDDEVRSIYTFVSGKAEGMYEAGMEADFPIMFVHAIEKWYGLR